MAISTNELQKFGKNLISCGKQPATVESYTRDASQFLSYLNANNISPVNVNKNTLINYEQFLTQNKKEKENSTRRMIIGVRQFYRFLSDENIISQSPFDEVPIPERNEALPKMLEEKDIEKMILYLLNKPQSLINSRNAAIIALLAYEGIKTTELIVLKWEDFLPGGDRASLFIGGNRKRTIELSSKTTSLLNQYHFYYKKFSSHPVIANAKEKRIFIAFKGKDGGMPIWQISRHGLKFVIYEIGEQVNIKNLNAELLRHFAVKYLILKGATPEKIMHHLGLRRLGNIAKHLNINHKKHDD